MGLGNFLVTDRENQESRQIFVIEMITKRYKKIQHETMSHAEHFNIKILTLVS